MRFGPKAKWGIHYVGPNLFPIAGKNNAGLSLFIKSKKEQKVSQRVKPPQGLGEGGGVKIQQTLKTLNGTGCEVLDGPISTMYTFVPHGIAMCFMS